MCDIDKMTLSTSHELHAGLSRPSFLGIDEVTKGFIWINRVFVSSITNILYIQNLMSLSFLKLVLECLLKELEKLSEKLAKYLMQ